MDNGLLYCAPMEVLADKVFAIVDVETTGSSPTGDRIIEIGILRIEHGVVVDTFESLIDPQKYVPPSIERITGINPRELEGAPTFEHVLERVRELLDGAIFVAHNARFDYAFIKNELKRQGVSFNAKCLCTVRLSRKLFAGERKHDLSSVIDRYDLTCSRRHRAFDDARVLWDFMLYVEHMGRGVELEEAVKNILKENTLPQFLDEKTVRTLPEGPGVYIFYGPEDEVLYVGKSLNVRYRVLSHFSNDHSTTKEMHLCQETSRVEAIETAGELSALLLESQLIKTLSPLYNRQLRRRSELVVVRKSLSKGYTTTTLERARSLTPLEYKYILGVFRNVRQAKNFLASAALEHTLCPKLLGLEKGRGACFAHQIGKCQGACMGKEEVHEYNKRLQEVFKSRRIKAWPFAGPIAIEEKRDDEERHVFVLDNWCLIQDIKVSAYDNEEHKHEPAFDYDAYKIFVRYIRNPLHKKHIKRLSSAEFSRMNKGEERIVELDSSI